MDAIYDTWVVGDLFLNKLDGKLQEFENAYKLDRKSGKPTLYLMDCYNLKMFKPQNDTISPAILRVSNALMEGINGNDRLPKYIIVVIDYDIIIDLNVFDYGAHKALKLHVDWIVNEFDVRTRRKKFQILEKKPGAVNDDHPTIIYVTMIKRVEHYKEGSLMAKVCSLRKKFNDLLNMAAARKEAKVLTIRSCNSPQHFEASGALSTKGKLAFWWEVDELIERFEMNKVKLLPRINNNTNTNNGDYDHTSQHRTFQNTTYHNDNFSPYDNYDRYYGDNGCDTHDRRHNNNSSSSQFIQNITSYHYDDRRPSSQRQMVLPRPPRR